MTQLNSDNEELEEEEGYSWTTYLGAVSAIGLASLAAYKFTKTKPEEKKLYD